MICLSFFPSQSLNCWSAHKKGSKIRSLNLAESALSDKSIEHIEQALRRHQLIQLNLKFCFLSDKAIKSICQGNVISTNGQQVFGEAELGV